MSLNFDLGSIQRYQISFLHPYGNKYHLNKFSIMRLVPFVIEEEGYEDPSCRFIRDDVDNLCLLAYDEVIWKKSTSVVVQIFSGNNYKESFQYFMEYYALKEEIREVLYFRDYYYPETQNLFKYPCFH